MVTVSVDVSVIDCYCISNYSVLVLIDRHTIDWLCDSHRNKDFNG